MTVMSGATRLAAHAPDTKSDANRSPKFLVFHTLGSTRGISATFEIGNIGFCAGWVSILCAGASSPGSRVIVKSLTLFQFNCWVTVSGQRSPVVGEDCAKALQVNWGCA